MLTCPGPDLILLWKNDLVESEQEYKGLTDHIQSCESCQKTLERLNDLLRPEPLPEVPVTIFAAIKERLAQEREHSAVLSEPKLNVHLKCSFCKDNLSPREAVYCASCLSPSHEDCFTNHGRCAALGCSETYFVKAQSVKVKEKPSAQTSQFIEQTSSSSANKNSSVLLRALATCAVLVVVSIGFTATGIYQDYVKQQQALKERQIALQREIAQRNKREEQLQQTLMTAQQYMQKGYTFFQKGRDFEIRGEVSQSLQAFKTAERHFLNCLDEMPKFGEAYVYLVETRVRLITKWDLHTINDMNGNVRAYGFSGDLDDSWRHYLQARVFGLEGRFQEADKTLAKVSPAYETEPLIRALKIDVALQLRQFAKAQTEIQELQKIDSWKFDALFYAGLSAYKQGNYADSSRFAKLCLELSRHSQRAKALGMLSEWIVVGRLEPSTEKLNDFQNLLAAGPQHYFAYYACALIFQKYNYDSSKARRFIAEAIEHAPHEAELHYIGAAIEWQSGDTAVALKSLKTCLKYDPEHIEALKLLALIKHRRKKYDESLVYIYRALALKPTNADLYFRRARTRWQQLSHSVPSGSPGRWANEQWQEVLADLNNAIKLDDSVAEYWGRRAYLNEQLAWAGVSNLSQEKQIAGFKALSSPILQDYEKAITLEKEALEQNTLDKNVLEKGGSAYWRGVRCILLVKLRHYKQAVSDGEAYINAGQLDKHELVSERVREALATARKALRASLK